MLFRQLSLILRLGMLGAGLAAFVYGTVLAMRQGDTPLLVGSFLLAGVMYYATWLHMRLERLEDRFALLIKESGVTNDLLASAMLDVPSRRM